MEMSESGPLAWPSACSSSEAGFSEWVKVYLYFTEAKQSMRDEQTLPLPVTSCFLLLIVIWKLSHHGATVWFQCWVSQLSKRYHRAGQRQGPHAFNKHSALAVAASSLVTKRPEDGEADQPFSSLLWIHGSGKRHASFPKLWWGLHQRLPWFGWPLFLSNEWWLLLSLLRQTSWSHQHLDENLILPISSHKYLQESNWAESCVILGRNYELSCAESCTSIAETELWAHQGLWNQRSMRTGLSSNWKRAYVDLGFTLSYHSSPQVLA